MESFEFAGNMIEKHDMYDLNNPSQNFLEVSNHGKLRSNLEKKKMPGKTLS